VALLRSRLRQTPPDAMKRAVSVLQVAWIGLRIGTGEALRFMSEPNAKDPSIPSHVLRPGELVEGRYRIEAVLGSGGMASVYRATHLALEQPVAIKVVSPLIRAIPGVAQRFMREARAATRLKSDHVARVFDVGTTRDGAPYMVMEFLDGKDLGSLVDEGRRLRIDQAVEYVLQACEALAEVHGVGIVHRDLKPANLFLTRGPDGRPHVKLIDFGISRIEAPLSIADASVLTNPDAIMGSPRYMSPEQMESASKADVRSDIWALGAVLYELLTGDAPYDGGTHLEIYASIAKGPPPAPSRFRNDVPRELDAIVLRCLETDPRKRYAHVAALGDALAPFGMEPADERAAGIRRVLETSRVRHGAGVIDAEAPETAERSHVRRRVSRSSRSARRGRRVAGALVLAGVAASAFAVGGRSVLARLEGRFSGPPRKQGTEMEPQAQPAEEQTAAPRTATTPPPAAATREVPPPPPPAAEPTIDESRPVTRANALPPAPKRRHAPSTSTPTTPRRRAPPRPEAAPLPPPQVASPPSAPLPPAPPPEPPEIPVQPEPAPATPTEEPQLFEDRK
jgi:eukaryotic-like serine/threonine-protein kinase